MSFPSENNSLAVRKQPYTDLVLEGSKDNIQSKLLYVGHSLKERFNAGRAFTFVRKKNDFSGEYGWKPKEIPNFDPVAPNMVLHDIWEHTPGSPATPVEEFQAIGTAMLVRFEGGFFEKVGSRPSDALAKAFGMLYFHAQVLADRPTSPCPQIKAAMTPIENLNTEMEMIRAIGQARDFIRGNPAFNVKRDAIDQSLQHALPWMRVGYRKAKIRFDGIDLRRLATVYFKASKKLEELIENQADNSEVRITPQAHLYKVGIRYQRHFEYEA